MTIASLLQAVSARDATAFATLVDEFDDDLIRLAFVVSRDVGTAEDAAQATWERLWRKPPDLRSPEALRSWLLTVVANEARGVARRRRRGQAIESRALTAHPIHGGDLADEILDLDRAIARLSDAEREVLGLRFVLDLSSADIAIHLGLSASGARVRLHRAIHKLRREMTDE